MGFNPTISAGERPQTYALDGAATETGFGPIYFIHILIIRKISRIKLLHFSSEVAWSHRVTCCSTRKAILEGQTIGKVRLTVHSPIRLEKKRNAQQNKWSDADFN